MTRTPAGDAHVRRVVVDTDTGIDDALALMVLAADPDVELVAVGTTHGNCTTEQSSANARLVLDLCGREDVPVVGGLSRPLVGQLSVAWSIHGHDGLGDCGRAPEPAPPAPPGRTAVERYLELGHEHPGALDLLALGPLTNLGAALLVDPGLLRRFRSVTVMGGTGPWRGGVDGDPTLGVGDPNTFHDPEAARLVADAPGDVTLVGVDVTMGCTVQGALLDRVDRPTTGHGRLAADIVQLYVGAYEQRYGTRCLALHDPLAAMVAVDLDVAAGFRHGPTAVVGPAGEERVVLAADGAAPPRRVLASVDVHRAVGHLLAALEQPLPGGVRR
jgi:inosine-uridine nucleoside N-ribohydrolase